MVTCFFLLAGDGSGRFRLGWDGNIPPLHCSSNPSVRIGPNNHREEVLVYRFKLILLLIFCTTPEIQEVDTRS